MFRHLFLILPDIINPFDDTYYCFQYRLLSVTYFQTLFHGPVFQEVEEVVRSSPAGIMVKCRKRSPAGSFDELGQYAGKEDSVALDVVMQTFLIWARHERGCAALPTGCKHLEYYGALKKNEVYYTTLAADQMSMQDATWNAHFNVHDKAGNVFIRGTAAVTLHENLTY
jgi:hypothetical protein